MALFNFSGVAVIILFAIGILTFFLLFIFGKRQIVRLALKSHHGVHFPIAYEAPKWLKQEIERRLNVVKNIKCEPRMMASLDDGQSQHEKCNHYWRMRAVDSMATLQNAIEESSGDSHFKKPAGQDWRVFLLKLTKDDGPLSGCDSKLIHEFVDCYNCARHEPTPVFGEEDFQQFNNLFNSVMTRINYKSRTVSEQTTSKLKTTAAQLALNGKTEVSIVGGKTTGEVDSHETSV